MTRLTNCPRCDLSVIKETVESSIGTTLFWRCKCGWSKCFAESGTFERASAEQIAGVVESAEEQSPEELGDKQYVTRKKG